MNRTLQNHNQNWGGTKPIKQTTNCSTFKCTVLQHDNRAEMNVSCVNKRPIRYEYGSVPAQKLSGTVAHLQKRTDSFWRLLSYVLSQSPGRGGGGAPLIAIRVCAAQMQCGCIFGTVLKQVIIFHMHVENFKISANLTLELVLKNCLFLERGITLVANPFQNEVHIGGLGSTHPSRPIRELYS